MTTSQPIQFRGTRDADDLPSFAQHLELDASVAAEATADGLRVIEVAAVVLIGLLVCPPLAVLTFLLVVPALVVGLLGGLVVATLSTPYLLFHHFRGHDSGHLSLLGHRLHTAGRALIDAAPHRIVADVRKASSGR